MKQSGMKQSGEFANRRQRLLNQLSQNADPKQSIAVFLSAAKLQLRNGDTHYPYRQNSDFYYLTGLNEPEAVAVLLATPAGPQFILFSQPRDPQFERWNGARIGQEGACKELGADGAWPISEFDGKLEALLANCQRVYCPFNGNKDLTEKIFKVAGQLSHKQRAGIIAPTEFYNVEPLLHELRLFKSTDEIKLMQKAAQISVEAHRHMISKIRPGMYEYELEAELLHSFYRQGSRFPAYPTIVGAGANSCTLHYTANNTRLMDGDLVLIDAGAEYEGYAADITRTVPVNGKFSDPQKAIYLIVLKAQEAAFQLIKPGCCWIDIQAVVINVITEGLLEAGILTGTVDNLINIKAYEQFYMHNFGHWLGLDVHDAGNYKIHGQWRRLEAGMVLTVEPGIYISPDPSVDKKWWNIGIRIEDDVLVTANGYELLTAGLPRTVGEIEGLMLGDARKF